jgi:hypothetical protein
VLPIQLITPHGLTTLNANRSGDEYHVSALDFPQPLKVGRDDQISLVLPDGATIHYAHVQLREASDVPKTLVANNPFGQLGQEIGKILSNIKILGFRANPQKEPPVGQNPHNPHNPHNQAPNEQHEQHEQHEQQALTHQDWPWKQ